METGRTGGAISDRANEFRSIFNSGCDVFATVHAAILRLEGISALQNVSARSAIFRDFDIGAEVSAIGRRRAESYVMSDAEWEVYPMFDEPQMSIVAWRASRQIGPSSSLLARTSKNERDLATRKWHLKQEAERESA